MEPTFDFVTVKSGDETWARLSGEDTATILVPTTDGKAELVFTSDPQGRRGGFSATYVGTDDGCGEGLCGEHGTCDGGGSECLLRRLRRALLYRAALPSSGAGRRGWREDDLPGARRAIARGGGVRLGV